MSRKLSSSYAFRLSVAAVGAAGLLLAIVGGLAWISDTSSASIPPAGTPQLEVVPLAQVLMAEVNKQLDAAVETGVITSECRASIVGTAEKCMEACISRDAGFSLAIDATNCAVFQCKCSDGFEVPILGLAE